MCMETCLVRDLEAGRRIIVDGFEHPLTVARVSEELCGLVAIDVIDTDEIAVTAGLPPCHTFVVCATDLVYVG